MPQFTLQQAVALALQFQQAERLPDAMEDRGIPSDRLEFVGWLDRPQYLRMFDRIDMALDPLPYNGITTTCDALYIGTPVLTPIGHTPAGRAGQAILTTIGMGELIARTPDEFVDIGAQLALDIPRLTEIRRGLRRRMTGSPLMDGPRFARNMEAAYREMWRSWCVAR